MPVPVPRISKPPAHPVIKQDHRRHTQRPSPKEQRPSSLPSWRRISRPGEHSLRHFQDFCLGLTAAGNAPVIKGPHAEACIPPMHILIHPPQPSANPGISFDRATQGQAEDPIGNNLTLSDISQHSKQWLDHCNPPCSSSGHGFQVIESNISQVGSLKYSASSNSFRSGAFSPILEESPTSAPVRHPDPGSSPIEPFTPFGEFVDRIMAEAQQSSAAPLDSLLSQSQDYYQEKQVTLEAFHAAPVFPSITEPPPKEPEPAEITVTPTASSEYKKLAEPLSGWVANYIWKVCTSGFSLSSTFAQPCPNAKPYAATAPADFALSIHSLLLSTLLQPSAIFLALWYIVRLPVYFGAAPLDPEFANEISFRTALLGETSDVSDISEASQSSPVFRLVVLGCMLANKWLDDHTFSNKTWHSISNIPVHDLNKLESLALDIFSYDLSVSSQQWSQWLAHVISYHLSLGSPNYPQPISRPSSNPHSIVRRSIEEIINASVILMPSSQPPEPIFLGLQERLKEKLEKEQAMDVLEINLDEDGPLREEYLPKRRSNKLQANQSRDDNHTMQISKPWHVVEAPAVKLLPPPAKWSPAGDEPILRDRNRVSGQYVAVQAQSLDLARDFSFNQNWNLPVGFLPVKTQAGAYMYDMPQLAGINQPSYSHFEHVPLPHSRSQSFTYEDNLMSRNHLRSYSHSRFEYRGSDLRTAASEHAAAIFQSDFKWMEAAGHYPYPGPAFIHIPAVAW